ncbi:MAG: NAD(P)-dependent oxidoreductase [Candidatus Omnitrophica bacterium]|nr:NAD(P)-dependent oxidoreductase [Candidatus Omnitrophota bacterium]
MRPSALITGVTGIIGRHLSQELLARGWELCFLVRPGSLKKSPAKSLSSGSICSYDGSTQSVMRVFQKKKPQVVFHLAASTLIEHEPSDIEPLIQSNVLLGTQILEAMRQTDCRYLVNAGTYWQHYANEAYNPVNLYAATKQAFEDIIRYYTETTPITSLTLKLYNVYCPNDTRPKLFHHIAQSIKNKKTLDLSPGRQKLDHVYITDVVDAFIYAAELLCKKRKDALHSSYAVGTGAKHSLREVVRIYEDVSGEKLKVNWGGRPYRPREIMDPGNVRFLPGWKAKVSLKEGIRRVYER